MFTGGHRVRQLGSKLLAALALFCAFSALGASAPVANSIIPIGATYANISGSVAYQLSVTPGTTYFGIVTNATGFIEDNNFVNYVTGGQGILFVAPAGSQQGGANPLFALGGAGTVVGGAVQEQVYAVTTVANITASNLAVIKSLSAAGLVSTPFVFGFSTSNQVAVGSSGTNGIDFLNGAGINFDLLGSPVVRITNDVAHVGAATLLLDNATVLAWGINGASLGPEIFYNPLHSGDPEFIYTSGNSMSFLAGQGNQGKSVIQWGTGHAAHEMFYFVCDGFPGTADITGEAWPSNNINSKELIFQSGFFSNSAAAFPQTALRGEFFGGGTNGISELAFYNPCSTSLRATNSSNPGTKQMGIGIGYVSVNNSLIVGATNGSLGASGNLTVTNGNEYIANANGVLSLFGFTNAAPSATQLGGASGNAAALWISNGPVLYLTIRSNATTTTFRIPGTVN